MTEMTFSDDFMIGSMQELIDVIDEMGSVPFFTNAEQTQIEKILK